MTNGRKILTDPAATSADETLPAFLARPGGAPVYHGFLVVPETYTDGWCMGVITEFAEPQGCMSGDAFVVAPDGSRAGLVWEVGSGEFEEILPPDAERWGVYVVWFSEPVRTVEDLTRGFREVLPALQAVHARLSASGG